MSDHTNPPFQRCLAKIDLTLYGDVDVNMKSITYRFRTAGSEDLVAINQVITDSVMTWPMAERLKRLAINVLRYDVTDLAHFKAVVAQHQQEIIAVVVWDPHTEELLCHGLYVTPEYQDQGLGQRLLEELYEVATSAGQTAIQVKAERVSCDYFAKQGFTRLPPVAENDYPYLFRKRLQCKESAQAAIK